MGNRDPRVDAYIRNAAPFAQPILTTIRDTVHASCPDVEEAMKWSFPHSSAESALQHSVVQAARRSVLEAARDRRRSADAMVTSAG
jgi:uncharacterized protein YdhG (YjbR/CyaY superfamily)